MAFNHVRQLIESKATSLNQVAATFKKVKFAQGSLNLDYGGGRYDKAAEILAAQGCSNHVYDPFNRSASHNLRVRLTVAKAGLADTASVNNVLNVIAQADAMRQAIEQAANGIKEHGQAYFLIHEGDGTGVGRQTIKGWQRNQKAQSYMEAILESFGGAERKGTLIRAWSPKRSAATLFDLQTVQAELLAQAKARGVPMPSSKHGVGKLIGGCLYLHRSCWEELPQEALCKALASIPGDFNPAIAKWETKTGCISLIESDGFDLEEEPAIQRSAKVFPDGRVSITPAKSDPQIYHHKWNFVRPGHSGFDYHASIARSLDWAELDCDRSRIGTRSHWEEHVVRPHLAGAGAAGGRPVIGSAAPSKSKKR